MDTVLSRVEKGNNKQLHDIVQKYSSAEISRQQYTHIPGFEYQERNQFIFMFKFSLKIENNVVVVYIKQGNNCPHRC
jgi:hypothetical protein